MRLTQERPSVALSRRRLAGERTLPSVRAIGTPKRAPLAAQAQVAGIRDRQPAADRPAFDDGDGGHAQSFESGDVAVDFLLVGDAVLAGFELAELLDVGAGDERLAAGAAQQGEAERGVAVDRLAGGGEVVIHAPGHGVARGRAVEGDARDWAVHLQAHAAGVGFFGGVSAAHGSKAPRWRRSASASPPRPISVSTSSVCSPSSGG